MICGLNLLHTPELISNCRTITSTDWNTPCNDGSIFQNRSKGMICGLNLLHTPELISNCRTITSTDWNTPCNDRRKWIALRKQCKCWSAKRVYRRNWWCRLSKLWRRQASMWTRRCGALNPRRSMLKVTVTYSMLLLGFNAPHRIHLPKSQQRHDLWPESATHPWADLELPNYHLHTQIGTPHVTTDPSSKIAAKAWSVAWICYTPLSWSRTAELSPPQIGTPHVTTDPSSKIAAKAWSVAWICYTPLSWSRTAELSPPQIGTPHVTTDPSTKIAAKCTICSLNLLQTPELMLNFWTVTSKVCITPGHNRDVSMTPQGKSLSCCSQLRLKYRSCKALSVLYLCFF